jgi:soluble lytic murein transglycosylase-like protein|tara:strand:+ start:1444 stop:2097 length:654 start_codon:yes stop_codon:yes gene_type:complete
MAEVKLVYPASGLVSPSSWGSREGIKKMIDNINSKYGTYIDFVSKESKLPKEMITAFIAVESGGNATAGASGHITQGLMQWNRTYAKSQLETEKKLGRMTKAEQDKLASYGIKFDANGKTRAITNADQLKPELNILIGSMLLGQLVDTDWGTENGEIKLDRVIAVYNAGAYGDTGKKARSKAYKTPKDLASAVNSITSAYIKKILGSDGALDLTKIA